MRKPDGKEKPDHYKGKDGSSEYSLQELVKGVTEENLHGES